MCKKRIILLSLIAAILCSSCNTAVTGPSSVTTSLSAEQSTSAVSETTTTTAEQTSALSTTTTASSAAETVTTSDTAGTTETTTLTAAEETSAASSETVPSETTETSPAVTETKTETTTTVKATEVLTETEVPVADFPPAEIKVRKISSPGTLEKREETAVIDYRNAADGYISALYSGKSKRAKLRIVANGITCDHDLSVTGEAEYFPLMQGSGEYRIQIYEQLDGKLYSAVLDLSVELTVESDTRMYLYPNRYSMFGESSVCVVKSAEICGGAKSDIEKISAIFNYIAENITYDYDLAATVQSGYIPDPDTVFAKKSGICFDYASLFVAMARSQNIPARLVIGYASPDIYHAWNEVYTEETGWITPELLLSQKGYNIVDATFYAGSDDKEKIAGYISDSGNYTSVYKY